MIKQVKDLTATESERFCDNRREQNRTSRPYDACIDCPLRWAHQCVPCESVMPKNLVTRMRNVIGERNVNISEE